jgi:hypothetical protein
MSALGSNKIENLSERRELSDAAKALLADKAFGYAYLELRQRWFGELQNQPHAGPMQDELNARLRALDLLHVELALLIDNFRVDIQQQRRRDA